MEKYNFCFSLHNMQFLEERPAESAGLLTSGQKMPVHQHPAAIPPNAYSASRAPAPLRTAPDGAGKRPQAPAHRPTGCRM